jgi:hypothetical protein
MKNKVTRLLSIGIALAAAVAVQAQDKIITANVPFSFYVASSLMPQGAYRVSEFASGTVVRIAAAQGSAAKSMTTIDLAGKKQAEPARLVFHCYGNEYFLAEIWTGDTPPGQGIARSTREKELARTRAGKRLAMIQVYLNR